jgi:hypothetical protein
VLSTKITLRRNIRRLAPDMQNIVQQNKGSSGGTDLRARRWRQRTRKFGF